jgi:hypothetical protein
MKLNEVLELLYEATVQGIASYIDNQIKVLENKNSTDEEKMNAIKTLARMAPDPNKQLQVKDYGAGETGQLINQYKRLNAYFTKNKEALKNIPIDTAKAKNAHDGILNSLNNLYSVIKSGQEKEVKAKSPKGGEITSKDLGKGVGYKGPNLTQPQTVAPTLA